MNKEEKIKNVFENLCNNLIESFSLMKESVSNFVNFYYDTNEYNESENIVINSFLDKQKLLYFFYFVNCARSLRDWLISINSFKEVNKTFKPNYTGFLKSTNNNENEFNEKRCEILKTIKNDKTLSTIFYNLFLYEEEGITTKEQKTKIEKKIKNCDFYSLFLHWDKYAIKINKFDLKISNKNKNYFTFTEKIERYNFDNEEESSFFKNVINKFEEMIKNTNSKEFQSSIEKLFNQVINLCNLNLNKGIYYGLRESSESIFLKETVRIISKKNISKKL